MRITNHKAQHLSEYAIIFSIVLAALIAMQTYVKRGLQGGYKDAADGVASSLGSTTTQYEPYYSESDITSTANTKRTETTSLGGSVKSQIDYTTTRQGEQKVLPR